MRSELESRLLLGMHDHVLYLCVGARVFIFSLATICFNLPNSQMSSELCLTPRTGAEALQDVSL